MVPFALLRVTNAKPSSPQQRPTRSGPCRVLTAGSLLAGTRSMLLYDLRHARPPARPRARLHPRRRAHARARRRRQRRRVRGGRGGAAPAAALRRRRPARHPEPPRRAHRHHQAATTRSATSWTSRAQQTSFDAFGAYGAGEATVFGVGRPVPGLRPGASRAGAVRRRSASGRCSAAASSRRTPGRARAR